MIQIPANFIKKYSTFIDLKGVPQQQQHYYAKWLRYYIDFCNKYGFPDRASHTFRHSFGGLSTFATCKPFASGKL